MVVYLQRSTPICCVDIGFLLMPCRKTFSASFFLLTTQKPHKSSSCKNRSLASSSKVTYTTIQYKKSTQSFILQTEVN